MANMSYCRFENTYRDMKDCMNALERVKYEDEPISESEWYYVRKLAELCDDFYGCFEVADVPSVKCCDLMDTSNGHDKELVRRINKAYDEANHYFCTIVQYLIRTQCGEASCDETDMYTACHWYCQDVADNRDLEIILNYCRM